MKKDRKSNQVPRERSHKTDIERGVINDNFLAALVTSKVYKMQVVKAKKGKGSYSRKSKYQGKESYLIVA